MTRPATLIAPVALAAALLAPAASAFTFSLTPITNTTPTFAPPIQITGTVTMAAGETFYSPNAMSTVNLPFLSTYTAGFNGNGQTWDPAFLAWNGLGTYNGPIYDNQISTNNLGYAGGMPIGLYASNLLGPGGQSSLTLWCTDATGQDRASTATYAINVVPAPASLALIASGLLATKRRRDR